MGDIQNNVKFRNNNIEEPDLYLGAILNKKELNCQMMWTMTIQEYIKSAIDNLENKLNKKRLNLNACAGTPMKMGYKPEIDSSSEIDQEAITIFYEIIGIIRWAVDIGRVDILTEISILSSYQDSPKKGRLKQIYHVFDFLKKNSNLTLYSDPIETLIGQSWFRGDSVDNFKNK